MSRLGNLAPTLQKATGAARFAVPVEPHDHKSSIMSKHNNIKATQPDEKERTTLYLPLDVQERFADLRRQLRRRGVKPREASNSALVERVFRKITDEAILDLF